MARANSGTDRWAVSEPDDLTVVFVQDDDASPLYAPLMNARATVVLVESVKEGDG